MSRRAGRGRIGLTAEGAADAVPIPRDDPYLESRQHWRDFHGSFLCCLRAAIADRIAPRYIVSLEEALYLDHDGERGPLFAVADVAVRSQPHPEHAGGGRLLVATPSVVGTLPRPRAVVKSRKWLRVRDGNSRKVVSVIELLSSSDKRTGLARDKYLDKRAKLLGSKTHLIEIDLLRGGQRMPTKGLPDCDYFCVVSRHPGRPKAEFWPFDLEQPLPELPLPLLPGEAEPVFALKPVLDRVYDEGHYADRIYTEVPEPPFTPEQIAWAAGLLPLQTTAPGVTPG